MQSRNQTELESQDRCFIPWESNCGNQLMKQLNPALGQLSQVKMASLSLIRKWLHKTEMVSLKDV